MTFRKDFDRGRDWENQLLSAIQDKFPSAHEVLVCTQLKHGGDVYVPSLSLWVEAKHDYTAARTGNLYLETVVMYRGGKTFPGWTYKLPPNTLVCWKVADDEYYAIMEKDIRRVLSEDNLRTVKYTKKEPNTVGALLPTRSLKRFYSLSEVVNIIEKSPQTRSVEDSSSWVGLGGNEKEMI